MGWLFQGRPPCSGGSRDANRCLCLRPRSRLDEFPPRRCSQRNGTIRVLINGSLPSPSSFHLIDVNAPDVSYDGTRIVFAGLPEGSYSAGVTNNPGAWRIFVINTDGSGLRQVVRDQCRRHRARTRV